MMTKKKSGYHKTTEVIARGKGVEVDVQIAPFIEYLNKVPGITTEYSCQGFRQLSRRKDKMHWAKDPYGVQTEVGLPYVMFSCIDQNALLMFLTLMQLKLNTYHGIRLAVDSGYYLSYEQQRVRYTWYIPWKLFNLIKKTEWKL